MICKFCGNVIEDNSDFCFICGQKNPQQEEVTAASEAVNNNVFSQTAENESEVAVATAPAAPEAPVYDESAAPIYAQSAPIYAQSAPVYAQQAIIQQVAPAQIIKTKGGKGSSVATKSTKFFAALFSALFILQFIPWIWYNNAKKAGYEQKSVDILNSIMIGLCIFMGVLCLFFVKSYML